jgi:acetyltransferase-like isoleucine patch superfamily enzyme
MKSVLVPTTDVNSEKAVLVNWHVANCSRVAKGDRIGEVETSKAVIEVEAPEAGFLYQSFAVGETVVLAAPIAHLFEDFAMLERFEAETAKEREAEAARVHATGGIRATAQARKRAEELGIDLAKLDASRLITVEDVEAEAMAVAPADYSSMPNPLASALRVQRLLLIGGALGATQVIDILRDCPERAAVAILDDDRSRWGAEVCGIPVIGGTGRLKPLFEDKGFDAAIITIGGSIPARVKFRKLCESHGIPLANAIDRTAKLGSEVKIGSGNIICAFCHIGNGTTIGDNNFFSAHCSFDHHNALGSDITTGPACVTSGLVTIGHRVKMGMGVLIEPGVALGDDVQVASGAIILKSVPADHAVKARTVNTTVVPNRKF